MVSKYDLIALDIAQRAVRDVEFSDVYEHDATEDFSDEELEVVFDLVRAHKVVAP